MARRLDPVRERFEADLLAGRRPRLEDFLPQVEETDRPALLRELLGLELEDRARRGEHPGAEEYHRRLPEYAAVLDEVIAAVPTWAPAVAAGSTSGVVRTPPLVPLAHGPTDLSVGRGDRYVFEGEIARGGMGVVYRVRDPELQRPLAVKALLDKHQRNEELERRFRAEAQITAQMQHPGIPPVHEVGRLPDGRPFFAMKLVRGSTLAELLRERADPADDRPRFVGIFLQVCQTLAYAHSKGVIHRDLKPSNVHGGRLRRGPGHGLGTGQGPAPGDRGRAAPAIPGRGCDPPGARRQPTRGSLGHAGRLRAWYAGLHAAGASPRGERPAGRAGGRVRIGRHPV
jgi:hypothetical protein